MFTQAMPAFANSLRSGQMFPAMQALGNCQQPLSHRGGVNFTPGPGLNNRGVYTSLSWNPALYQFPGGPVFADLGGMNVNWNAGNRYDSQFFFPTDQFFTQNQFFGGPQVHVQGGFQADAVNADTYVGGSISVENVTAEVVNGVAAGGRPGPPGGGVGRQGAPGFPGRPGQDGAIPQGQFAGLNYLNGIQPRVVFKPEPVQKPHRYVKDAFVAPLISVGVPNNAASGGTVTLSTVEVAVPTGVSFNPSTCEVTFTGTTTIYSLAQANATLTVATTAATTTPVTALGPASLLASSTSGSGVLVKGADALFWGEPDPVLVARDPELKDVVPQPQRQVFQR